MNPTQPDAHLAFKSAVEARDADAVRRCLSADVHFHSPIRFTPFVGRDEVAPAMQIPTTVSAFRDTFRYTPVFSAGAEHALSFEADEIQRFAAAATQIVNSWSNT